MAMVVVCLGPPLSHDCCDMKKMFKYGIENKALAEMKAHIVAELFNSCVNNTTFSGLWYHSSKGCAGRFRSFHKDHPSTYFLGMNRLYSSNIFML